MKSSTQPLVWDGKIFGLFLVDEYKNSDEGKKKVSWGNNQFSFKICDDPIKINDQI